MWSFSGTENLDVELFEENLWQSSHHLTPEAPEPVAEVPEPDPEAARSPVWISGPANE